MTHSSRPRETANLSESLHHRLDIYAMAASAAGVGILALAQPSEAKIVYTPANVPISGIVSIDLNHDGIVDLTISLFGYDAEAFMNATSIGQNRVWGSGHLASHLRAGVNVGPNQKKFAKGMLCYSISHGKRHTCKFMNEIDFRTGSNSTGPWAKTKNGYLGLKFYIKGKVHFGWARLQRARLLSDDWVLTGYAYETIVGKPIVTGQKKGPDVTVVQASLGHLARGSAAIPAWRLKQTTMITH